MESERRNPFPVKANLPKLGGLLVLSNKLNSLSRLSFVNKFGNILDLLSVDVQTEALTALAQFYDPPTRSFLFKDFQLALTLEEFERIMGIPKKK